MLPDFFAQFNLPAFIADLPATELVNTAWPNLGLVATTVVSVGGAFTVGGGLMFWLFREKLVHWVRAQTHAVRMRMEERLSTLEENHTTHEGEIMRVAESMERISETMNESMKRQTMALERISVKHEETAMAVARIEGSLERRAR